MPENSPPRILIVRLSAMGDVIHGIPVLHALRTAFPQAFLGWVVSGRNGDLLEGHPDLDQLFRISRRWWKSPREIFDLRRQLHEQKFDMTLDLQCLSKSAFAARLSGAKRRIGYSGKLGREISTWLNNELVEVDTQHVIDRYLAILKPLGIENPSVGFNLPEQAADADFAKQTCQDLKLPIHGFAILNPGAGWVSKQWPAERYGELAARLWREKRLRSLAVWAGDTERQLAQTIVEASTGGAVLAPATSMQQLASLARKARLFIGSDTGPLHLAVAVNTPSISLHGTSLAAETGAYGNQNRRLQAEYDNSAGKRRHDDNRAMRAITTDAVYAACEELLSSP